MNDFRSLIRNSVLDILGIFSRPQNGIHILNGHMICRGVANDQAKYYFSYQLKELSRHVRFIRVEEATSLILNHEVSMNLWLPLHLTMVLWNVIQ